MNGQIDDAVIDALTVEWDDQNSPPKPYIANVPPEARVIRDFLNTPFWGNRIRFIFSGVLERSGRISDESGFLFPEDLEPGDEPFDGVQMFDPLDTITLSDGAFDRLMSRYFRVVLDRAESLNLPITQEPWWGAFADATVQIEQRTN
ncbi:hypothetical protein H6G41_07430 [Tolypothrix sp. FACHB-123]|uniref:hypothetical protein n=1 Tax=Tolypothrix sp. FACHB-123 TaxID=2692868 RepID=UPI001684DBBC|nr:hypothetical protein [Tolypothrix sp. FACHB-123]MBD2354459.1 hypothetical protein [Tolypothrix sp. FACHB-123]